MKFLLACLTLSLFSSASFAKDPSLDYIFQQGIAALDLGKARGVLNPIMCLDSESNDMLIYSRDFRHLEDAFIVRQGKIKHVQTSSLGLQEAHEGSEGRYNKSIVQMGNQVFLCASDMMQLESAGGF